MSAAKKNKAEGGDAPKLLAGGNPQIAKGVGDEPVQAYIAAMPEWKSAVGSRIDGLIEKTVPGVHKAVRWNQPFYGVDEDGWFIAYRCYTKYVQLQFFRGSSLEPNPPKRAKHEEIRYLDIYEDDDLDEAQIIDWISQSTKLPPMKI